MTTRDKDKVSTCMKVEGFKKEPLTIINRSLDKELKNGQMVENMKVNLKKERCKEKVHKLGLTEQLTQVITKMVKCMEKELTSILMEVNTKENIA